MTTYSPIVLNGCAPVPLAGYLKALGVLRLVAEQADENARGFWQNERFVLRTRLTKDELVQFFAEKYEPSPIVGPWNKSSGYWKSDKKPRRSIITKAESLQGNRYVAFCNAVRTCLQAVDALKIDNLPEDAVKAEPLKRKLIASLRDRGDDELSSWIDSVVAITGAENSRKPSYAPVLGKGAIDARLDFAFSFANAQVLLAESNIEDRLFLSEASLFSSPYIGHVNESLGQFDPSAAGGYNSTVGIEANSSANLFDIALTIEGTMALAGGVSRRNAAEQVIYQAVFPFVTKSLGTGSGATSTVEESGSNADFWAPLWGRPAGFDELKHLFREGRAILSNKNVEDSLDFARSIAALSIYRGLDSFQRFGFYQRAGDAHRATPLSRIQVKEHPRASLISELDADRWLSRARDVTRYAIKNGKIDRSKEAPASLRLVGRDLDEALFRLAADGSPEAVQDVLIALGALMLSAAQRPKLRESLPLPPRLSEEWAAAADDSSPENDVSHEFALAEALASLDADADNYRLPFRRHLVPLDWEKGRWKWGQGTGAQALAVWSGRNLVRDMASVLERRLIEAQRHSFSNQGNAELPLWGWRAAPLGSVAAFLAGRTDDDRIAALAAGLAWTKARRGAPSVVVHVGRVVGFNEAAVNSPRKPMKIPACDCTGSASMRPR